MAVKKKSTKRTAKPRNTEKAVELYREAPQERHLTKADVVGSVMADAQLRVLTSPTPAHAIKTRVGPGHKLLKYVPHGYVTDQLNKAFGFDWDFKLMPYFDNGQVFHLEKVKTGVNQKTKEDIFSYYVSVYGELTVRIHNPKKLSEVIAIVTKPGPGSAVWYPENELGDALKAAKSDGLKVAAHELGIALDLYYDDAAELAKYEEKQREQKAKEEAAEIVDAIESEEGEPEIPQDVFHLITQAKGTLGLDVNAVKQILGDKFMQETNTAEMWEKLVKSQEKKA